MPLVRRILVPIDGSLPAVKAADYAIDIAKRRNAHLMVIHVMHSSAYTFTPTPISVGTSIPPVTMTISGREVEIARNYLSKIKRRAKRAGIQVETKLIENQQSVVNAIADFARKADIDLIVMGTKGRTGIKKFLLGSVASGVLTYAPCPVLVVR